MVVDHTRYSLSESSGYGSSTSPDLHCSKGGSSRGSWRSNTMAIHQNALLAPNVVSDESQLSVSPGNSSLHPHLSQSLEFSKDSGVDCESFSSSIKDSMVHELDEEIKLHLLQVPPVSSESIASSSDISEILPGCPSSGTNLKLWQSTPVYGEGRTTHLAFVDSCELEKSPTKRRRSLRRSSRDLFQSSKKKSSLPSLLALHHPSASNSHQTSFIGKEAVDFLYYLGKREIHQPALDAILGYLEPADLCRASIVSKSWKNVIESVPIALRRKRDHADQCIKNQENLHQSVKKSSGGLPFRGQLIAIQNLSRTEEVSSAEPRSPPVSPSKVRFNLYLKEGRKLETGQTLIQCPNCKLPSRKETERSARCTRRGCQYYFCILCLCKFHGDKLCPVSSVRHRKRPTAIGSRESRRNLLRLCK